MSTPPEVARELPFRDGKAGFSLILKRNCSISPAGLAGVFLALAAVTLGIGAAFALVGAWLVLPFAGLEVMLLGAAYLLYARRAADYESIELKAGRLTVEVAQAEKVTRYEMDARMARVCLEGSRVWLRGGARGQLELGRHLNARGREILAGELARRLQTRSGEPER